MTQNNKSTSQAQSGGQAQTLFGPVLLGPALKHMSEPLSAELVAIGPILTFPKDGASRTNLWTNG